MGAQSIYLYPAVNPLNNRIHPPDVFFFPAKPLGICNKYLMQTRLYKITRSGSSTDLNSFPTHAVFSILLRRTPIHFTTH